LGVVGVDDFGYVDMQAFRAYSIEVAWHCGSVVYSSMYKGAVWL